jgi:hypothetical protein
VQPPPPPPGFAVAVGVCVGLSEEVAVDVGVGVGGTVGTGVEVAVRVGVGVTVGTSVALAVGVAIGTKAILKTLSLPDPVTYTLPALSTAMPTGPSRRFAPPPVESMVLLLGTRTVPARFGGGPAEKEGESVAIQGQQNPAPISNVAHAEHAPLTTLSTNNLHAKRAATMPEQHSASGVSSLRDGAREFYEMRERTALGVI